MSKFCRLEFVGSVSFFSPLSVVSCCSWDDLRGSCCWGREPILSSLGTAELSWPCAKSFREPSWFFPWDSFSFVPQRVTELAHELRGCQALLVLLAGLEHKTSPTSFFSYQDLQIDQVTARSHFWGAVFSSPLCVILFIMLLSAFRSLIGVGGVECLLPPFK